MTTVASAVKHAESGWNVYVGPEIRGAHRIHISRGLILKRRKSLVVSTSEAEQIENSIGDWLLRRPNAAKRVRFKMDTYGGQWLEVRRGLFRWARIRLGSNKMNSIWNALH